LWLLPTPKLAGIVHQTVLDSFDHAKPAALLEATAPRHAASADPSQLKDPQKHQELSHQWAIAVTQKSNFHALLEVMTQ
jgi:hypothetical protein